MIITWTADLYPAIPAGTRTAKVNVIAACVVASLTPSKTTDTSTYTVPVSGDTAAEVVTAPTYRQIDTLAVKDCEYALSYSFEVEASANDLSTYSPWLIWTLGSTNDFTLKTTNPDTTTPTTTLAVTLVADVTTTNKDGAFAVNKGYVLNANLRREQCATLTFNTPTSFDASIAVEDMRDSDVTFTDAGDNIGLCGTRAMSIINDPPSATWVTVAQVGVTSEYKITASPRLVAAATYNLKLKIASVEYPTQTDETNTFTVVVTKCVLVSVVQSNPTGNTLEYTIPASGPLTAATPLVITPWTQTSAVASQFCVYAEDFSYAFNNVAYTTLADVSWLNVKVGDAGTLEAYPTVDTVASEKLTVTVSTILQDAGATPGSNTFEVLAFLKRADCDGRTMNDIATLPQSPVPSIVTLVHKDYTISKISFTDPLDNSSAKCGDRSFKLVNSEADQTNVPSWVKLTFNSGTYTITVITLDVSATETKEFSLRVKSNFYDSLSAPTIADRFYIFKVDI